MQGPPNTWFCAQCEFYVFNSKKQCGKCGTLKPAPQPVKVPTLAQLEARMTPADLLRLEENPGCSRCELDGRRRNKDPMLSSHNCWKYS